LRHTNLVFRKLGGIPNQLQVKRWWNWPLETILPNFFLCYFFCFLLLSYVILMQCIFSICIKHSSLTSKIGKRRKAKFRVIDSRTKIVEGHVIKGMLWSHFYHLRSSLIQSYHLRSSLIQSYHLWSSLIQSWQPLLTF